MATELKSQSILDLLSGYLETDEGKQLQKKINLVYQFHLAPKKIGVDEVIITVNLKKGEVTKGPYEGGKPDATFSLKDEDFVKLAEGKLNPQIAFMRGALKIKGSLSAAQKFTPDIFPKPSKL
ncbi:sterol carrier protein 2 [Ricinus communis]|uniref:Sterol carrier, putative n=1 Tax=Ricinus communis TaxID=3988 RepID=B9R7C4_RICCO|nr:sterol carrier protein 2 [Ricinus communis]EEF52404.1 sterol carrier, putative [Ricinus communis]|eukprot:XP_002510217.1 peroxisomal multifunctional enzyme type 2 [Ricinus communis]